MSGLTFTQALLQAEAQARSTLDVALHERLSCAVSLVKDGRVFQTSDGTWQVDSTSRGGLVHNVNGVCSCEDAHFQAPQGLCKHRLAVYLARRAQQLMHQPPAPVVPPVVEPWPDNDPEPTQALAMVPRAPVSPSPRCRASARGARDARQPVPHPLGGARGP